MNLRSHHLFSGSQLYTTVSGLLGKWAGIHVWISRAACVYVRLDARGIPWHGRSAFVRLQLPTHALYAHTGYFASYANDSVHLWMWDQSALEVAMQSQGVPLQRMRCLPETVGHSYAGALAQLVACRSLPLADLHASATGDQAPVGFEGLLWRANNQGKYALADNIWWPEKPTTDQWAAFLGKSTGAATPPIAPVPRAAAYLKPSRRMPCVARGVVRHGTVSDTHGLWHSKANGEPAGIVNTLAKTPWLTLCWMLGALALCANAAGVVQQWHVLEQAKMQMLRSTPAIVAAEPNRSAGYGMPGTPKEAMAAAIAANDQALGTAKYFAGPNLLSI